jgi:hypothetical protein
MDASAGGKIGFMDLGGASSGAASNGSDSFASVFLSMLRIATRDPRGRTPDLRLPERLPLARGVPTLTSR